MFGRNLMITELIDKMCRLLCISKQVSKKDISIPFRREVVYTGNVKRLPKPKSLRPSDKL